MIVPGMLQGRQNPQYDIVALPSVSGLPETMGTALNDNGDIIGISFLDVPKGTKHAGTGVYWENLQPRELGEQVNPFGINNRGNVVGNRIAKGGLQAFATLDAHLSLSAIGLDSLFITAIAINDNGQIAGTFYDSSSEPFVWEDGKRRNLPLPAGTLDARASAMNELGDVVGSITLSGDGQEDGSESIVWKNNRPIVFNCLPRQQFSAATAVNIRCEVVGNCWNDGREPGTVSPYIWSDGHIRELDAHIGSKLHSATVLGINDGGTVVGFIEVSPWIVHACIWQHGKRMDLNDLIPPHPDMRLSSAVGINNRGQILCNACENGRWQAFLLTPTE